MIKKLITALLVIIILATAVPFSVSADYTLTQKINGINVTRYTDYLVIYNKSGYTTGTNVYGCEAVVTDGFVTAVGGNNSVIPNGANSFVVSGHGTMSEWVSNNVVVGMKASYDADKKTVSFVYDSETALFSVNIARETALDAKEKALRGCFAYSSSADERLSAAEESYDALKTNFSETKANALVAEYKAISLLYTDRGVAEYRGIWVRPEEKNYAQVEALVKRCHEAGINMISVETMYSGTLIYPPEEGSLFEHNPDFKGFDVLDAYVTACHKYGIELHCWMPIFYSGNTNGNNWRRSVAYKKPEWRALTNSKKMLYDTETSGMVFLNPAIDEVREFLLDTYEHLLENYDIDGFQLDYIRYRDRTSSNDYGYDNETISQFKQAYPQYKNQTITYDRSAVYWNDFVEFRAGLVTKFVGEMHTMLKTVAPDVILSIDVGADTRVSYNDLYQDSLSWVKNGWIDIIHPMAYGDGYAPGMANFINAAGDRALVVPGLGTFMSEFDAEDMVRQTAEMLAAGCDGVVYFESDSFFSKNCGKALTSNVFDKESIPPMIDRSASFEAVLNRIRERIGVALERGLVSGSEADKLSDLISSTEECGLGDANGAIQSLEQSRSVFGSIKETELALRLKSDVALATKLAVIALESDWAVNTAISKVVYNKTDYIVLGNGVAVLSAKSLKKLMNASITENGKEIDYSLPLKTGMVLNDGNKEYIIAVRGDVNGNGKVDTFDYALVKRAYLGTFELDDSGKIAATGSAAEITTLTYASIKRHVLNTFNLYE